MKNAVILALIVMGLVCTGWIAARGPQAGYVEGEFADYIRVGFQTAYLVADEREPGRRLDSCLVVDRRFLLRGSVPRKGLACHIEFSGYDIRPAVRLERKTTVRLRITAEPEPFWSPLLEERIAQKADSLGADTMRQQKTKTNR